MGFLYVVDRRRKGSSDEWERLKEEDGNEIVIGEMGRARAEVSQRQRDAEFEFRFIKKD